MAIKKIKYVVSAIALCVMLMACGAKTDDSVRNIMPENEEATSTDSVDNASSGAAGKDKEVYAQNNGKHFVGMNDNRIYYITPDDDAMYASRLFAEYIDSYCGMSFIMAYDCEQDSLITVKDGCFYGKLCVLKDTLFVNCFEEDGEYGKTMVAVVNPEEKTVKYAEGKELSGGDSAGNYVVTLGERSADETSFYVYTDNDSATEVKIEDYAEFVAIEEGYLVVACKNEAVKELRCYDINDSLKEYKLGITPERETENMGEYPEFEQCLIKDGKLYLNISWYEGTGHFFAEQAVVSAELTKNDSLVKLNLPESSYGVEEGASAFVVNNGVLEVSEGIPGNGFCEYTGGDYGYFDENGKKVVCGNGYGVQHDEEGEVSFLNECTEYVDGRICMVNNHLARDPEEDIGWRYAYIRKYTSIFIEENGSEGRNVENIVNWNFVDED